MPYMPTNFYPKNCAIDISKNLTKYLTWSADLDRYDIIDKAEIIIYSYYSKEPIASILLEDDEEDKGIATIRFSQTNYGKIDWWEPEYDTSGNISYDEKNGKMKKIYTTYIIEFNKSLFPMTSENGFKFDLPLKLSSDFTVRELTSRGSEKTIKDNDDYQEAISRLLLENFKYYWTLSVSSSSFYDTWVTDGYIEKTGSAGTKQYYKTFPNSYIMPQGSDVFDFENTEAYTEQKMYNESTGKQYAFAVENGTGYFNETGTALKIGYYKSDEYKESSDGKNTTLNYYYKRYAIFDSVLNCLDNQGQSIFGTEKSEKNHRFYVYDISLDSNNLPVVKGTGKQSIVGVGGTPREPETLELTIDIYKFPVKNIYTMAYYYPAKVANGKNDFLLIDSTKIKVDQNFRPIKIVTDTTDEDNPTTTVTYLDELDETDEECLKGPYTVVEYEDAENLFPLWSEKETLEADDIEFLPDAGSIAITSEHKIVTKELSGQYLELNRTKTTLRIDVSKNEQDTLAFSVGDYFQIKSNSVVSFENYYETVSDLRVAIYESDLFDKDDITEFNVLTLSGPSCSFTGKYGIYQGDSSSNKIDIDDIKEKEFEWSYWEIYRTSYHKNEKVELGKELVYTSEKDYSRKLFLTYNNFINITETSDYVQTYYEVVLFVKDKKNIVFSSSPVKIKPNIKTSSSSLLQTYWDDEKQGIYVNFNKYMPSVKAVSYTYPSEINAEKDKVIGGKPNDYFQIKLPEESYEKYRSYMFLNDDKAAFIGSLDDEEFKIGQMVNEVVCYFVFKLREKDFDGTLFSMYFNTNKTNRKTIKFTVEPIHTEKENTVIIPDRIRIEYDGVVDYLYLAEEETESINPDIIRTIPDISADKIKNHYLDTDTTYSFSENAQFLADDILNCNEPISCFIYFDNNRKIKVLMQIPYGKERFKNYTFTSSNSFYNIINTGNPVNDEKQIPRLNRVDFYPKVGYREFFVGLKDSCFNYFVSNEQLKDAIGKKELVDTEYGNAEKDFVVLYKNFGVGNPLNFSTGSDQKLDWDHTMLYRYCCDPDSKEILSVLLISDFYCPNRSFWDYSVSNNYVYSYSFIPIYKRIDTGKPYEEYISNLVASSDQFVRPEYEDTTIFSATSLYSKDKIYYINPYNNSNHRWSFLLDVNDDAITFTTESSVTAGAKYAKVSKSDVIYMQGQVTAKLGKLKNESVYYKDDFYSLQLLKQFLNQTNMKMLRLKNGMCIPVDTQIKTATSQSKLIENPTDISFDWFQIEDEEEFFFYEPAIALG